MPKTRVYEVEASRTGTGSLYLSYPSKGVAAIVPFTSFADAMTQARELIAPYVRAKSYKVQMVAKRVVTTTEVLVEWDSAIGLIGPVEDCRNGKCSHVAAVS